MATKRRGSKGATSRPRPRSRKRKSPLTKSLTKLRKQALRKLRSLDRAIADAALSRKRKAAAKRRKKPAIIVRAKHASHGALSPAYKARLRRALLAGKSRTAARGHAPGEAARRRERESARASMFGTLTDAQKRRIKRFADQQAARDPGSDPAILSSRMREWSIRNGFSRFENIMSDVRKNSDTFKHFRRSGTRREWRSSSERHTIVYPGTADSASGSSDYNEFDYSPDYLQDLYTDIPDTAWFYYH